MNSEQLKQVYAYLDGKQEEMAKVLEELVSLESHTHNVEGVKAVQRRVAELFEAEGMKCELVEGGGPNAPTLLGVLGADRPGKPAAFSGHLDTVIKKGVYPEPVFRREGMKAFGPGVLDMKGGVVISLYVVKALNSAGYQERPIKIAYSGDEEIGHAQDEKNAAILTETAAGLACDFNMETSLLNNTICVGRKGRLGVNITVTGVESHAGNDFASGRNAIAEMAHKIIKIQELTDLERDLTVSVGIISGGTVANAIPKTCTVEIDIRFSDLASMEYCREQLEAITAERHIPDTSAEMVVASKMPPFECTDQVMGFFKFMQETAKECGLQELNAKKLGGGSDASYIQMAGIPVVCSTGITGEWNHTTREYALLDSMIPRAKLLASVIMNLNKYEAK